MQHEHIEELIIKSFSSEINPEERQILSEWINESSDNEIYYAQLKNIWQASYPAFQITEIDTEKAEQILKHKINNHWYKKPIFVWWQRVAAIAVIPLIVLSAYLLTNNNSLNNTEFVYQEVVSPPGVNSKINLPDGSIAWLNSGSTLKYPATSQKNNRNVYLSGEAYFEVKSDKDNPFTVTTEQISVKATGTAFNVEAYPADSIAAVTLIEGKVSVNITGGDEINMQPNQRINYNNKSRVYQLNDVAPYKWYAWKDGILMFRNDRLDYVLKRIGLTYNVDIEVKDEEIGASPYRATFQEETIDEILRLMKMTAPIEYKKQGRTMQQDGSYSKEKIEVYKAK